MPAIYRLCALTWSTYSYAYLGDVGESVTGDKRAQHFEDAYLDELLHKQETGFDA